MLKYLQFQLACDIMFGLFMVVWVMTRHIFYLLVVWSLHTDAAREIKYGCYWGLASDLQGPMDPPDQLGHLVQPFLNPVGLVCWNANVARSFIATLLALQVILLLWFGMIIRVAVKVVKGGQAEDSRSDEEGSSEGEEEGDETYHNGKCNSNGLTEALPYEEEVGVEAMNLAYRRTSPPRKSRKGGGTASGVSIPSDRKELLGRIGCDKGA